MGFFKDLVPLFLFLHQSGSVQADTLFSGKDNHISARGDMRWVPSFSSHQQRQQPHVIRQLPAADDNTIQVPEPELRAILSHIQQLEDEVKRYLSGSSSAPSTLPPTGEALSPNLLGSKMASAVPGSNSPLKNDAKGDPLPGEPIDFKQAAQNNANSLVVASEGFPSASDEAALLKEVTQLVITTEQIGGVTRITKTMTLTSTVTVPVTQSATPPAGLPPAGFALFQQQQQQQQQPQQQQSGRPSALALFQPPKNTSRNTQDQPKSPLHVFNDQLIANATFFRPASPVRRPDSLSDSLVTPIATPTSFALPTSVGTPAAMTPSTPLAGNGTFFRLARARKHASAVPSKSFKTVTLTGGTRRR